MKPIVYAAFSLFFALTGCGNANTPSTGDGSIASDAQFASLCARAGGTCRPYAESASCTGTTAPVAHWGDRPCPEGQFCCLPIPADPTAGINGLYPYCVADGEQFALAYRSISRCQAFEGTVYLCAANATCQHRASDCPDVAMDPMLASLRGRARCSLLNCGPLQCKAPCVCSDARRGTCDCPAL